MTTYAIHWSDGTIERGFLRYCDAVAAVQLIFGGRAVIGHAGSRDDGGESTLFWASEKLAKDDDGSRAAGKIQQGHAS